MIGNWIVLGDGFGWQLATCGVRWIYWAPGTQTQEGEISWKEIDINPRVQGSLYKSDEELHQEVLVKALPRMKAEVKRRIEQRAGQSQRSQASEKGFFPIAGIQAGSDL
jgi:hypothetical protein